MIDRFIQIVRRPQVWGFFVSIVVMAAVSLAFFYPDAFEGGSLRQADMQQGAANGQEGAAWCQATGEKALWTNSLFGGMPTFQISPSYPSNSLFSWLNDVFGLWLPAPANLLFMMMFGFLILLFVLRLPWYYSLLGSIAWGFSSYFVIIIGAGHIWKFLALSFIPPTIGGMLLCYRGRYVAGAALLAVFAMLQLAANHPQMSYYFFLVMAAMAIAKLVEAYRQKRMRRWWIATAACVVGGVLAVGANLPNLYNTYEYARETKRSQSELATAAPSANPGAPKPTGGLPYNDIVGWSYGRTESLSLLVPDIKGGASSRPEKGAMQRMSLSRLSDAKEFSEQNGGALLPDLTQYFNDSEGTNGPVYVGALICALFLLGCMVVRGPMKWALLVMTLLSLLLAWGRNCQWLTDLMIYHFPLYNKFRTVESILVIAEFTMPLLAVVALHKLLTTPDAFKRWKRPLIIAFAVPALICLLAWLVPSIFGDAITEQDRYKVSRLQQDIVAQAQAYNYDDVQTSQLVYYYSLSNPTNLRAIESLRYGMVSSDGLRSLIVLLLGAGVLWAFKVGRLRQGMAVGAITAIVLVDLYTVDKRYVSHDCFIEPSPTATSAITFTPDAIDQAILADTAQSYRVLDIENFSSPNRSYFHKMVGGYHAAKLNRFEDLIQNRLMPVLTYGYVPELRDDSIANLYGGEERMIVDELRAGYRVLDMLNTRYVITGEADAPVLVNNTSALGNAWIIDSLAYVDGAVAEMDALARIDPRHQAVADRAFAEALGEVEAASEGDTIRLTEYTPNRLTYHVSTRHGGVAVFSEVWFPWGWHATIDGEEAQLGRVNYVLRALRVPEGDHTVVMTFDPQSIHTTTGIAYSSITLIYLLCIAGLFFNHSPFRSWGKD